MLKSHPSALVPRRGRGKEIDRKALTKKRGRRDRFWYHRASAPTWRHPLCPAAAEPHAHLG